MAIRKRQIKGLIGYFGLADWWLSAFTDEERRHIGETFQPLGFSGDTLTSGDVSYTSQTSIGLLSSLVGWFLKANDRAIAYRILEKAEELATKERARETADERSIAYKRLKKAEELARTKADDLASVYKIRNEIKQLAKEVLDRHFMHQTKVELYYRDRDKPGHLEKAIEACGQQIELAPQAAEAFRAAYQGSSLPCHTGYHQLAIILEKQRDFGEAIRLCTRAQEGWAGDWEQRIERCRRRMAKVSAKKRPPTQWSHNL